MNNNGLLWKIIIILNFSLVATLLLLSHAEAVEYKTTKITNNGYYDGYPQINIKGQVAWAGFSGIYPNDSNYDINLWDNGKIKTVVNNIDTAGGVAHFDLNDNGQIVWYQYNESKSKLQIYLYSNGAINNISNNNFDNFRPSINNKGQAVWSLYDGTNYNVCLYDKGNISLIHTNSPGPPADLQINDKGNFAWLEPIYGSSNRTVYFYYNGVLNNLSNDVSGNLLLNEMNQLVFRGKKYNIINRYNNGIFKQIANDQYEKANISINDIGQIVWDQQPPSGVTNNDIFVYDNGTIRQIIKTWEDNNARINNYGEIVWQGSDSQDYQYDIFLNINGITTQITNDSIQKMFPKINDNGLIVWEGGNGQNTEIYIATPIPVPATLLLLGSGLLGLAGWRRFRKG